MAEMDLDYVGFDQPLKVSTQEPLDRSHVIDRAVGFKEVFKFRFNSRVVRKIHKIVNVKAKSQRGRCRLVLQYPAVCMRRQRRAVTHTTECPAR